MIKRKRQIRLPTDRELALMLARIRHPRNQLIVVLALKLGLRASEIVNLKLSDFEWDRKTVSFIGKGSKPATLPLTDEVLGYLERALNVRPTHCQHDFLIWNFRHKHKGITRFTVHFHIKKAGTAVCLKLHPHLLRHVFGTNVMKNGDIYRAKEALRHSRLSTTAEIYTHLDVESQREDFELLDSRPRLVRFLSKFKPPIPRFFIKQPVPTFTGDTIGRHKEIEKLNANVKVGIHTILCGPRGCGTSHLLRQITGANTYHIDSLKPAREKLVALCEQMQADGALTEIPKARATATLLKSLIETVRGHRFTVVIDSLTDISREGIELLQKLKSHFTIVGSIETKQRRKLNDIFFGSHEVIDMNNLKAEDAFQLADAASIDLATTSEGRELFLKRVVAESKGNPRAIMEIIEKERRRDRVVDSATDIGHESIQEPLSAAPFLSMFLIIAVVSRYGASSVGLPDLKIILIIGIVVIALLVFIEKLLKEEMRQ